MRLTLNDRPGQPHALTMRSMEYLIYAVCGATAGILAGLFGVGGGLVIVPVLVSVFAWQGIEQGQLMQLALGSSLTTIIATSASSTIAHHKRRAVRWNLVVKLAPGIIIGTWFGAALADATDSSQLKLAFGLAECCLAVYVYKNRSSHARPLSEPVWHWPRTSLAGSCIGLISALAGIGGGTVTVPYLSRGGLKMSKAVATSAACGLPIAISGSISYMIWGWGQTGLPSGSTGYVYWPAVLAIVCLSSLFAPLGAYWAHRLSETTLKRGFAALLMLLGLKMLLF